ncbi:MAG: TonB-dependent receptor family protein [Bacteroides sp.]|nr:TonB-dependent receptor family protein [Bacteroides sp.]MCM1379274.1 TonB-dependent receptor family protein [Bacteroides sp.]MCM1445068.1 TonB-dependent receptor family protein [Prevotella sp.]
MFQRFLNVIVLLLAGTVMVPASVVKGVVADSFGEPLPQATVRLLRANADSTFVAATATNLDGKFSFPSVAKGKYVVKAVYLGYKDATQSFTVADKNLTLDTLRMQESTIVLKEAVAIGIATPIKVMEDTIEYSASSYTTPPNAVVNDLLKRLPGVEIGTDGSITAQGETVKKILIDGEEFFSDDPKVAAKNIPVDMVKTAQVITRKSDLARTTGVDDGEDETVINLTVKDGMKHGWYGTIVGGYGPAIGENATFDWNKYKGSFIVNGMMGKNTVTILGNANNINDEGFTDNNGQRFRRFGGLDGVNTTQSLGVNFNLGNEKLRYGGNIMYSHNDRDNWSRTHRLNLFQDGDNTQDDTEKASRDKGHNIIANLRLKWDPDSFNSLDFRPNFLLNYNNSESNSFNTNYIQLATDPTTNSRNLSTSKGRSYDINGRIIYNHNFESHRGRSFSISGNYSFTNTHEDETSWSRNAYWLSYANPEKIDSLYEDYQENKNHTWNNGVNARLSWTEPLGDVKKGNFIEFAYMMNFRWNNADRLVYNDPMSVYANELTAEQLAEMQTWRELNWGKLGLSDRWAGLGELEYDPVNSNKFRNKYFNQQLRIGYRKVHSKYNLNVGLSFNPQMSKSDNLSNPDRTIPTRWVWNYAPFLRLRYKHSKQTSLNLFYNGRSSQPSMTQLQPVADTSDPMNIIKGNPNLSPSFTHDLHLRYQTFNADKQQSIMVMGFARFSQNAIAANITTDRATGARYTTYENVDGNWNFGLFSIYSRPFSNKAWTFNNNLHFNYSQDVGFTNGIKSKSGTLRAGESFSIAFRPSDLELELRPRYDLQYSNNSVQLNSNRLIHTYGGSFNATWYTRFGLVLATDLNYTANSGYSEGYNTKEWQWNASLSYMFLRGKNATIALEGKDLLNQHKSIRRTETAQAVTDTENYILGRYVMLTFTYKFSTFAGGKIPTNENSDFLRQGPPGAGMRPGPGGPR